MITKSNKSKEKGKPLEEKKGRLVVKKVLDNSGNSLSSTPTQSIAIGVSTFESLVERSSVFVDKSLFIKAFWENGAETLLTTYPRRSGKSINLQMLQTFFRIEVDVNGSPLPLSERIFRKYFVGGEIELATGVRKKLSPLHISNDAQMMSLQGEYPVIYMDMKECAGNTYEEILDTMRGVLNECFERHEYLLRSKILSPIDMLLFRRYLDSSSCDSFSLKEVYSSLRFLSKLLYRHFGKKVIILIDEYDAAINNAYMYLSDDDLKEVISLFRGVYGAALKGNEYLAKALVTGVMRIAKANLFSGLNNLGEYNITDGEFAPYYGFTQQEVDMLVNYYSIPDSISREIKNWYNGYNVEEYEIYNTWSVVKCLNKYQYLISREYYLRDQELLKRELLQNYWEESGNVEFIKKLFKRDIIKRKIDELVSGRFINFPLHSSITSEDFQILKEVTQLGSNYEITDHVSDIVFSYLMMGGYLTFADKGDESFTLPNHEIRHEFKGRLLEYYRSRYTVPTENFTDVTDRLGDLVTHLHNNKEYDTSLINFKNSFTFLLSSLPKFKNISKERIKDDSTDRVIHGNEDIVHCLMSYIALQLHSIKRLGSEISLEKGRADIAFINKKAVVGCVIELKYTEDSSKCEEAANAGLKQIEDKEYSKQLQKYYDVILLGVAISQDKKVAICDKRIFVDKKLSYEELPSLLEYDLT